MAWRISVRIGEHELAGLLGDTSTAGALAAHLPLAIRMTASAVGCCGKLPFTLPHDDALVHRGWTNGDINYNPGGGWLAIFFDDEENSCRYADQLSIGRIEGDLVWLAHHPGEHDVLFELAGDD